MNIYQAAEELQTRLERYDWLTAVAVGELDARNVIFVYLRYNPRSPEIESLKENGWKGFRVVVEKVGSVKPAHA